MTQPTHTELWDRCLRIIRDNIRPEQYDAWFKPVRSYGFDPQGCELTLVVPSPFFKEHFEDVYLGILGATLRRVYGPKIKLFYEYEVVAQMPDTTVKEAGRVGSASQGARGLFQTSVEPTFDSQLNPRYCFDNYCPSASNKIALTIAEAIATDPRCKTFNPLFVFGPTGVGKTHLIQAIGLAVQQADPRARILYVSARLFESQFTVASRTGRVNEFINFYQSIDTLIVDDIQDLIDKEKTQNTFFHIFNHLHQNQKQIIMSSDCAPVQLKGMPERLLSRFKWGMTVELEKPDLALRRAVLLLKAQQDGLSLPPEVMEFIAQNVTESVRELEGIVVSLLARATMLNQPVTVELARAVMANVIGQIRQREINFEMVTQSVAAHYDLDPDTLFTKSRKREISDARQMVMFMAKKHAHMPLTAIGTRLSRSHATVLYACRNIEERLPLEKALADHVQAIERDLLP